MTVEERLDRLEHTTAGWMEQSRQEFAQHRELWRDTQRQINEISRKLAQLSDRMISFEERMMSFEQRIEAQIVAIRSEADERGRKIDERIDKLVSAVGAD
jgi:chromosome segregation ATPase